MNPNEENKAGYGYYEAGFSLSKVTSGLTLGFGSYDAGSHLTGVDLHGNIC